jgi:hypothetical protein
MKTFLLLVVLAATLGMARAAKPKDLPEATVAELTKQLDTMVLEKIDFREASVAEAAEFLVARSKELDPQKVGFTIALAPEIRKQSERITLSLRNVPMIELIKYVTSLSNLKYKLTKGNVIMFEPVGK